MLDYDALHALQVFAQYSNFTHAARALHISQPALHAKINKLATSLDLKLYERQGRNIVITPAGEALARHAREVGALGRDLLGSLHPEAPRATIRLAAGQAAFLHLLGPHIDAARRQEWPLSLMPMSYAELSKALLDAHVDVGVAIHIKPHDDLLVEPWLTFNQALVMPRDHRLAAHDAVHPTDLRGERLIVAQRGHRMRHKTEELLERHDVDWSLALEASGWEIALKFVELGVGLTIANDFLTIPEALTSRPIRGFPDMHYTIARRKTQAHDGAIWLFDALFNARKIR